MIEPKLFAVMPEYVTTPDGMAIDSEGNLILACPNYAGGAPGCIVKIYKDRNIRKWFDVPVRDDTKIAAPMGIAFGPDGDLYVCDNQGWSGKDELMYKGRILRLRIDGDTIVKTTVVADNMEHPNGMRIRDGYVYVTQSSLSKVSDPSGKLVSCVYRFALDDEGIGVTNTLEDKNILTTFITENPACQYGVDGIEFDKNGDLLVGNFGDGAVWRVKFNDDLTVKEQFVWAQDPAELKSTDGMIMTDDGNLYIADFCDNAVVRVSPDGTVTRIAQSPDCDGLDGGLDQPGEPIFWNGSLVLSCFDLVTDETKVNTAHELPATLSEIIL
ncbi:MAG: phage head-tail adapter protein [Ruminococcaceae bacterium]|nr:phage head-tail adapter protein [Oscillospiraceae bacterium]